MGMGKDDEISKEAQKDWNADVILPTIPSLDYSTATITAKVAQSSVHNLQVYVRSTSPT